MGYDNSLGIFASSVPRRYLLDAGRRTQSGLEMLSSGHRVNRAAQDPAGLAMASGLGADLRGFVQGMGNVYAGLSMVETADSALGSTAGMLGRMRELAVAAANGILNSDQRDVLNSEFQALAAEIDRTAAGTQFNGHHLLDGSAGQVEVVVGQISASGLETITMDFSAGHDAASLGLSGAQLAGVDGDNAQATLAGLSQALATIGERRAALGGTGNRLMSAHRVLATALENATGAKSRLIDTDYASAASAIMSSRIQAYAATAVMGQTNQLPSGVQSLLSGD